MYIPLIRNASAVIKVSVVFHSANGFVIMGNATTSLYSYRLPQEPKWLHEPRSGELQRTTWCVLHTNKPKHAGE